MEGPSLQVHLFFGFLILRLPCFHVSWVFKITKTKQNKTKKLISFAKLKLWTIQLSYWDSPAWPSVESWDRGGVPPKQFSLFPLERHQLCFAERSELLCTAPLKNSAPRLRGPWFPSPGALENSRLNQKSCQLLHVMEEGRSVSLFKASSCGVCSPVIFRTVVSTKAIQRCNTEYPRVSPHSSWVLLHLCK